MMKSMNKKRWIIIGLMFSFCFVLSCAGLSKPQTSKFILLSSTIGPIDAGIVGLLEDEFEKDTAIRVRHLGSGTGAALDIARKGNVDLVLVHAKSLEEKFINEGFGTERIALMYNDFVIVGPPDDPAGIKGMTTAVDAFKKIVENQAKFISRGDKSGTNTKELAIWKAANLTPEGEWYINAGQGMGEVLTMAQEQQAYTLSDRATYLARTKQGLQLPLLVEGDKTLFNPYGVIAVSPTKNNMIQSDLANEFIDWLISVPIQEKISQFGQADFGQILFTPSSSLWKAAHPEQK